MKEKDTCERNYGMDLLRLVSMYLVVIQHVLFWETLNTVSGNTFKAAFLIRVAAVCGVDCFALMSGYLSGNRGYKLSHALKVWVLSCFYSFAISFVFFVVKRNVGFGTLFFSAFPILSNAYWYTTAYIGMYLFLPMILQYLHKATGKQQNFVVGSLLFATCIFNPIRKYIFGTDLLPAADSTNVLWLCVMFITGDWLRQKQAIRIKKSFLGICMFSLIVGTWYISVNNSLFRTILISNSSPTIVLMSAAMLLFFSKIRIGNTLKRIVAYLAPSAFSVYLIHFHPILFEEIIMNKIEWLLYLPIATEVLFIFLEAFLIFAVCILIDLVIRRPLFAVLHVDKLINKITSKIDWF